MDNVCGKKKRPPHINYNSLSISSRINQYKYLYLLLLIPTALLVIFCYMPMYGVIIAFKEYSLGLGIWKSPWNHLGNFKAILVDPFFFRILKNTLIFSLLTISTGFIATITFALLINEIKNLKYKKCVQTISYLPYFMSWVVLAGMLVDLLSPSYGLVNKTLQLFGIEPVYFLADNTWFRPVIVLSAIWKDTGWGSIIYLAALASVDIALYESADIDGANRFKKAVHISLPAIAPVITVMLILSLGNILNVNFDQIFNLYNPLVYDVADIIDTYVYRKGILSSSYGYASAIGLFKNAVGVILIVISNAIAKRINEYGIW